MTIPNSPIVQANISYISGLELSWTSVSTLTVFAGACSDSTLSNSIILPTGVVVNGAAVGVNGCDQAPLVASTFYSVFAIASSTNVYTSCVDLGGGQISCPSAPNPYPPGALLSLNTNSAPYLPFGYDMYKRIGFIKTDSSANILKFWAYGTAKQRTIYWDVPIALSTPTVTSPTLLTLPNSGSTGVVPLILSGAQTQVLLDLSYTPAVAGNVVQFLPGGSSGSVGVVRLSGVVAAVAQVADVLVPTANGGGGVGTLSLKYWMASSDALTTAVTGYVYNIS